MKRKEIIEVLVDIAKVLSFLSLFMTVVIKVRGLLGFDSISIKKPESQEQSK